MATEAGAASPALDDGDTSSLGKLLNVVFQLSKRPRRFRSKAQKFNSQRGSNMKETIRMGEFERPRSE